MSGPVARAVRLLLAAGVLIASGGLLFNVSAVSKPRPATRAETGPIATSRQLVLQGRRTFRYDTFGDEAFWGGALQLHQAIAGAEERRRRAGRQPEDGARGRPEGRRRRRSRPRSSSAIKTGKVDLDDPRPRSRCSSSTRSSA